MIIKNVDQSRRDSNSKCVCSEQQSCKMYEAKTDRTKMKNRKIYNYS